MLHEWYREIGSIDRTLRKILFGKRRIIAPDFAAVSQIAHDFPRCEDWRFMPILPSSKDLPAPLWTENDSAFSQMRRSQ